MEEKIKRTAENPANLIDLATNTNPLGMPPGVPHAIARSLTLCERYPDAACGELCGEIAKVRGIRPRQVLCGNGADDLIYRICHTVKPKRAVIPVPTFEEYETALRRSGCKISHYILQEEQGFRLLPDFLNSLTADIDLVFLCNPNNPTGQCIEPALLQNILKTCDALGILAVVDECFLGFLEDGAARSSVNYINQFQSLIIIDAFTKLYAMAGLRLGYGMSGNEALLRSVSQAGQAWSVSTPAQAGGIAALLDSAYLTESRRLIQHEKEWMLHEFSRLQIHIAGSAANYLFFPSPIAKLREKLEGEGILIRNCDGFAGLNKEYCRAAIKKHAWNQKFLLTMERLMNEG